MWLKTIVLICVLLLGVMPSLAVNGWYAFIVNTINGELVRVDASGQQQTFDLGVGENTFFGARDMAFSDDGGQMVFCPQTSDPQTGQTSATLIVRDLAANTNTLEVPMEAMGCRVTGAGYNAGLSQIAVGVVNYFPGDPNADTSRPTWQLQVYDATSGSLLHEINANSAEVTEAGILAETALIPEVRYFDNNQIIFTETPWAIGGAPEWRTFVWDLNAGTVTLDETGHWGKSGLSTLETTGEIVWLDHDPARPAGEAGGPIPIFNVVNIAYDTTRTIYHNGEWVLGSTAFINGGEELAVLLVSSFDVDNPEQQVTRWIALGRDGSVRELGGEALYSQIAAAPEGYIQFTLNADPATPEQQAFTLDYVANGTTSRLWEAQGMGWELAGTTPVVEADNLSAFPAVDS